MHLQMHNLNLWAILVAAISTMVVGFLWYSPLLFAKAWMKEMGYDPNDKAKTEEMKKSAGPVRIHIGIDPPWASGGRPAFRLDGRVPCVARICGHRAVNGCVVHEAEHEAVRY